jgi:hypothetical protein
MNNEPVAWMDDLSFFTEQPDDMEGVIPLYTHPAKTLTDEEIWEFIPMRRNDIFVEAEAEDFIQFARAILRKAQEK